MALKPIIAGQFYKSGGGGAPGGSTTQLQYNNAGSFGGISGWSTDGSNAITGAASTTLAIGGATIGSNALAVTGTTLLSSTLTITQATANTGILASTGYSLTGSNTTSMVSLAGTLNTSGVVAVVDVNITNTASGAGSSTLLFRRGAEKDLDVRTTGDVIIANGGTVGSTFNRNGVVSLGGGNLNVTASTVSIWTSFPYTWGTTNAPQIYGSVADTVEIRNAARAQALRVYGNVTGAHYTNLSHNGTNGVLNVAGGGVLLISSLPTANPGPGILWNNAGTPAIGT